MRNRSVVFVIRDNKILMEKIYFEERSFYTIPGGGIEGDETPEEAALRELKEECNLDGTIVKQLAEVYNQGRVEHSFLVNVPDDEEPVLGFDPEEPSDAQPIKEVKWMELKDIPEKDRTFLWGYGLIQIEEFFKEVLSWGDTISYPV